MGLKELLQSIVALNVQPKEFADALRNEAQPLFQECFNRGHSTATADDQGKLTELQNKLTQAESNVATAQQQLEQLRAEKPDVAKITQEFEQKLADAETRLATAKAEARAEVSRAHEDVARANLRAKLADRLLPEYADVIVERHRDRLKYSAEVKGVRVLQAGTTSVPIQSEDPLGTLADELFNAAPAAFKVSHADRGTGHNNGRDTTPPAKGKGLYDGIRAEVKARGEAQQDVPTAAQRLGMGAQSS